MDCSLGNVIADSLDMGLGYAERLRAGIPADKFARLAGTGRSLIQSNHPAFIFGHLSLYAPRITAHLGAEGVAVPQGFDELFSKDAVCRDDPDGTVYPGMDDVTDFFFSAYRSASRTLREAEDRLFAAPNPAGGRFARMLPSLGSVLAFYAGGHLMAHLGQLSAWRRMVGLPAA